jgi:hypothetical protein
MTTAALPQLRSRGVGELLDQAVRLYRQNFLKFIGIVALIQIPITLIQVVVSLVAFSGFFEQLENINNSSRANPAELFGPAYFIGIGASMLLGLISFLLIYGIAAAAVSRAVVGSYLGETGGIIEAYRKIGPSWQPLILTLLLAIFLGIVLFVWALIPCVGWLTGFGMMTFFWAVVVPLIAPIVIIEKHRPRDAIRRAWELSRRRFWAVLGFIFILFVFNFLVIGGPATLVSYVFQFTMGGGPFNFSASQLMIQTIIQSTLQLVMSLLYFPLQFIAVLLLYFDLRIRTEGFDLALLSAGLGSVPLQFDELAAGAPRPEGGNWFTMREMGYFVLIQLLVVVLYFIFASLIAGLFFGLATASGSSGF